MTAALTASPPAYLCVRCNAPWQPGAERCAECERRAANTPQAQVAALRAQLAAVSAERDALRAAVVEYLAAITARHKAASAGYGSRESRYDAMGAAEEKASEALAALRALLPTEPA